MPLYNPPSSSGLSAADAGKLYEGGRVRQGHKLLLASSDPVGYTASGAPSTLTPNLVKVPVPATVTLATMWCNIVGAGSTGVAGSNRMGVYSSAGVLLGQTADLTTAFESTGAKSAALTAEAGQSLTVTGGDGVFVWLALMCSFTTMPQPARRIPVSVAAANLGLVAADGWRCGTLAAVVATNALPASFTPSTGLTSSNIEYLIGAS